MKKEKRSRPDDITVIAPDLGQKSLLNLTTRVALMLQRLVSPPPTRQMDRTARDKRRFNERMGKPDRSRLKDILTDNDVLTGKKVKVPVTGGEEPTWKIGRERGGGGSGAGPGSERADIVYRELTYEEFVAWLFGELDLPDLKRTEEADATIHEFRLRGRTAHGPEHRILWDESSLKREERATAMLHNNPARFPVLDQYTLTALHQALLAIADGGASDRAALSAIEQLLARATAPPHSDQLQSKATAATDPDQLQAQATAATDPDQLQAQAIVLPDPAQSRLVLDLIARLDGHPAAGALDEETIDRSIRGFAALLVAPGVMPLLVAGEDIPSPRDVPFLDEDMVYRRAEEVVLPDSNAVVVCIKDISQSMSGRRLALAKLWFALLIAWLRSRYTTVTVVMVVHNVDAFEVESEADFHRVDTSGGTEFAPPYSLTLKILEDRFPASRYCRFVYHATDGIYVDKEAVVEEALANLVEAVTHFGYVEVQQSPKPSNWEVGGKLLEKLPDHLRTRISRSQAFNENQIADSVREIMTSKVA